MNEVVDLVGKELSIIVPGTGGNVAALGDADARLAALETLRDRAVKMGSELPVGRSRCDPRFARQRRTRLLPDRAHQRRAQVGAAYRAGGRACPEKATGGFGQAAAVPAE